MKQSIRACAFALLAAVALSACENTAEEGERDDSAATLDVDSGRTGVDVSAAEKTYDFDGTVTGVSGDNITVTHGGIGDFKDSGSTSFKLAHPDMAQYARTGERKHFTVTVVGEEALVKSIEDIADNDSAAVRRDTSKDE